MIAGAGHVNIVSTLGGHQAMVLTRCKSLL